METGPTGFKMIRAPLSRTVSDAEWAQEKIQTVNSNASISATVYCEVENLVNGRVPQLLISIAPHPLGFAPLFGVPVERI
jgi:hypothetical protein